VSWTIEVKPSAEKQYLKLDKATRQRIRKVLTELETLDDPFSHRSIRPLTGELRGDYRLRVGDWRILLTPQQGERILFVYAILPRSKAYS
jgi:mRNA interferase RelE/StbE